MKVVDFAQQTGSIGVEEVETCCLTRNGPFFGLRIVAWFWFHRFAGFWWQQDLECWRRQSRIVVIFWVASVVEDRGIGTSGAIAILQVPHGLLTQPFIPDRRSCNKLQEDACSHQAHFQNALPINICSCVLHNDTFPPWIQHPELGFYPYPWKH